MKRAVVGIVVVVVVAFLQASAGLDGFQLLERECGILEPSERMGPKIINGVAATFGAHPWMAYLHTPTFFTCAGTLINHWFVLTAAHCIKDGVQLTVRLGEYDRDHTEDCQGNVCMDTTQEYDVSMSFKHGFYKPNDHTNDIGMLRLESRVTYTVHIQPICVFVDSAMKPLVDSVTWFNATGWGRTVAKGKTARVLQELRLNRRPKEDCAQMFGKRMLPEQICSGNDDGNLCNGDSGGPQGREMAYDDRRVYVQLGIASFTNSDCKNVSILTDVVSHGGWIKRVVRMYGVPGDGVSAGPSLARYPTFYRPL